MSNIYIHHENQTLLWNTINKMPESQYIDPNARAILFKNIIREYYDKEPNVIDKEHLRNLNRSTVRTIANEMKKLVNVNVSKPPLYPSPPPTQPVYLGKDQERDIRSEQFTKSLENRQQEYQNMFKKPAPPDVDFREKLDDTPINNIEELVAKHRMDREGEMYNPGPAQNIIPQPTPSQLLATSQLNDAAAISANNISITMYEKKTLSAIEGDIVKIYEIIHSVSERITSLKKMVTSLHETITKSVNEVIET